MGLCMKTTVELDDALLKMCKALAVKESTTMKALIEEGLRLILSRRDQQASRQKTPVKLPVCSQSGGVLSGVNLNDASDLEDRMNA